MAISKVTSLFLGSAVAVGGLAAYFNHERSELAEYFKATTLANGASEAQAECIKTSMNMAPLMTVVYGSSKQQDDLIAGIRSGCNLK